MELTVYPFVVSIDVPELPCASLVARLEFSASIGSEDLGGLRSVLTDWADRVRSGAFPTTRVPKHGASTSPWHVELNQIGPNMVEFELYGMICSDDAIPALLAALHSIHSLTSVEIE